MIVEEVRKSAEKKTPSKPVSVIQSTKSPTTSGKSVNPKEGLSIFPALAEKAVEITKSLIPTPAKLNVETKDPKTTSSSKKVTDQTHNKTPSISKKQSSKPSTSSEGIPSTSRSNPWTTPQRLLADTPQKSSESAFSSHIKQTPQRGVKRIFQVML